MASDKSTDFIKRNRKPRVHISYEDPYDSEQMVELPFVMGVMSDLSGNNSPVEKPAFDEREFTDVTSASLDSYMESVAPGVTFNVEDKLNPDSGQKLGVDLQFRKMDDLNPAEVARQVPALRKLLEAREHLANLQRYMSSKPKAQDQVAKLLNDPELLKVLAERSKEATNEDEKTEDN